MNSNFDTKKVITHLLTNNLITGRITTDPCEYKKDIQVQVSFDDVMIDKNVALLYDTENDTRAELTGLFKLPLDLIEEAHFVDDILHLDYLYGKYDVLLYLGEELDTEVLLTFNMKDSKKSPFVLDDEDELAYAYAVDSVQQLDYFVGKPVKINLSAMSCFSTYDVDGCTYSNPVYASLEINSLGYEFKVHDNIPCITITDQENENIKLVLNAISYIRECNVGDSDKRIFIFESEIGGITIMDKGYVYPCRREVA
jgi:hypothetical protein